jgi:hypothetical protein
MFLLICSFSSLAQERDVLSGLSLPRGLEQEPGAPPGFIDPDFQQAGGGNIVVLLAETMRLAPLLCVQIQPPRPLPQGMHVRSLI